MLEGSFPYLTSDFWGSRRGCLLPLACVATINPYRLAFHKMRLLLKEKKNQCPPPPTAPHTIKSDPNDLLPRYCFPGILSPRLVLYGLRPTACGWDTELLLLLFVCLFPKDRVSLCGPGGPGTLFVGQASLKLRNLPSPASQVPGSKVCASMPIFQTQSL